MLTKDELVRCWKTRPMREKEVFDQAKQAIDLAAENERLKDERKRLIENNTILSDALDRANDKLGEIRDMCLLASGKGESYETSWFSGYSACADVIVEIIDKDGDEK